MVQAVFEVRLVVHTFVVKKQDVPPLLVLGPAAPPATTRGECGERARCRRATPGSTPPPRWGRRRRLWRPRTRRGRRSTRIWRAVSGARWKRRWVPRAGSPVPCDAREIRAEVKRFLRLHGQAPGSAPSCSGSARSWRRRAGGPSRWRGASTPRPLTQSGGAGAAAVRPGRRRALVRLLQPPRGPVRARVSVSSEGEPLPLRAKWLAAPPARPGRRRETVQGSCTAADRKTLSHANPARRARRGRGPLPRTRRVQVESIVHDDDITLLAAAGSSGWTRLANVLFLVAVVARLCQDAVRNGDAAVTMRRPCFRTCATVRPGRGAHRVARMLGTLHGRPFAAQRPRDGKSSNRTRMSDCSTAETRRSRRRTRRAPARPAGAATGSGTSCSRAGSAPSTARRALDLREACSAQRSCACTSTRTAFSHSTRTS